MQNKRPLREQDQDRGGNISAEEFGRVMRKTNPNISDAEVAKIIGEVDLDGDGTINFDEFITMMTGQPYKSPETKAECTHSAAAVRGVSTLSARLQRQRLANQVFKDAWAAVDPTLKNLLALEQVRGVAEAAGLVVGEEELAELKGEGEEQMISCKSSFFLSFGSTGYLLTILVCNVDERFLEFAKRQEVDDIVSGYGA